MAIVTGLVSDLGCIRLRIRGADGEMVPRVAADLVTWRIDDGPVEHGRLRVMKTMRSEAEPDNWDEVIRPNHLLRITSVAAPDEGATFGTSDLAIEEAHPLPVGSDPELEQLAAQHSVTSAPTEPWHVAPLRQSATFPGDSAALDAFAVSILEAKEQNPSSLWLVGPHNQLSEGTIYKFRCTSDDSQPILAAHPSITVQLREADGLITIAAVRCDTKIGNGVLNRFLNDFGTTAAESQGHAIQLSAGEVVLPDIKRLEPVDIPGIGWFQPNYRVNQTDLGDLKVSVYSYDSEPLRLGALGGQKLPLSIDGPERPSAAEAEIIGRSALSFMEASPDRIRGIEDHLLQDHLRWCEFTGNPAEVHSPEDVWSTTVFASPPTVSVVDGDNGPEGTVRIDVSLTWAGHGHRLDVSDEGRWRIEKY